MKTPEQMAEEYASEYVTDPGYILSKSGFLAGYQAAKNQLADTNKVTTADYVENAINDAKQLICTFKLQGDKDILIKALVAAYCSGVDAVDGYLKNSLSAYRNSVKRLQWISVKERLPETNELCIVNTEFRAIVPALYGNESWIFDDGQGWLEKALSYVSHWMPLPKPPKEEK